MFSGWKVFLVLSAAAGLLAVSAAEAQEVTTFGDVIDVELVNVEVWVTDQRGRPIGGLTAADFEVREDGEPVDVTHFQPARLPAADEPPPAIEQTAPVSQADDPDPGHLVLYFDLHNLSLLSRERLFRQLRPFLASQAVPPERVMILTQGRDLQIRMYFGASAAQLDEALREIEATPVVAEAVRAKRSEIKQIQGDWASAQSSFDPCGQFARPAIRQAQVYSQRASARISSTLAHLSVVTTFLAGVPGLKTLILFGDALEATPGSELFTFIAEVCPAYRRDVLSGRSSSVKDLGLSMRRLTRHANANRVTIHSIKASGLHAGYLSGAEIGPGAAAGRNTGMEAELRSDEFSGLSFLAADTGGRLVVGSTRLDDQLSDIVGDMSSYYSLAYSPPHGGDGGEHRIRVKVRSPGRKVIVRHRRRYRDKSADERMSERLQSALYLDQVTNPLAARLGVGDVRKGPNDRYTLPIHVLVPSASLAFLPHEGGEQAHLQLQIAARNTADGKVTFDRKLFQADRPNHQLQEFAVDLELRQGEHIVAVGIRDEATRETSYLSTAIEVQGPKVAAGDTERRQVVDVFWDILTAWADGSETAPADLTEWQQSVIDSSAGVEVTAATYRALPHRPSSDGGPGTVLLPGLPCLDKVVDYTAKRLARLDTEALLPLAELYRRAFREHLGPPLRFWLLSHNQDRFDQLVEAFAQEGSDLSRRRVVLAWMTMADDLAASGIQRMGDEARKMYGRALDLDPENQVARYWAGYLDEQYGHYAKAGRHFERLAADRPDDAEVRLRLAVNLARVGRDREAAAILESIASAEVADGNHPDWTRIVAFQELGRLYAHSDVAKAATYLEAGRRSFPRNARLAIQLSHQQPPAGQRAIALAAEAEAGWNGDPGPSPRRRYELPRKDGILEERRNFQSEIASLRPALGEAMRTLLKEGTLPPFDRCDGAEP